MTNDPVQNEKDTIEMAYRRGVYQSAARVLELLQGGGDIETVKALVKILKGIRASNTKHFHLLDDAMAMLKKAAP